MSVFKPKRYILLTFNELHAILKESSEIWKKGNVVSVHKKRRQKLSEKLLSYQLTSYS